MDKLVDKIIPKVIHKSYTNLNPFYPQANLMVKLKNKPISTEKYAPNNNKYEFNKFKFKLCLGSYGDNLDSMLSIQS
ncbi:hypothetical protein [Alkanindiges illinoisensis]|uniref:Uncharacterized protein n=1 Tax=Alkanindiges illinoisensis TaxID=197183 RepID=A0A4Y7XBR1_9GAMM|nr:hypothetical protein [Alkanindiges illinoisensis]TEU25520.1 hypothetical protein E2B99_09115 [Alkanindiges illinoisensis]